MQNIFKEMQQERWISSRSLRYRVRLLACNQNLLPRPRYAYTRNKICEPNLATHSNTDSEFRFQETEAYVTYLLSILLPHKPEITQFCNPSTKKVSKKETKNTPPSRLNCDLQEKENLFKCRLGSELPVSLVPRFVSHI